MDQEILVDEQIEEGHDLIEKLSGAGCDVTVAFWAKMSDGRMWYIYISPRSYVAATPPGDIWRLIFDAMEQIQPRSFGLSDIRLIPPTDPIALAAIKASQIRHPHRATRLLEGSLGRLAVDGAYIYPKPTGTMGRNSVARQVADLMTRAEGLDPVMVVLRDGTQISAYPVALQRPNGGGVDVVWRDANSGLERTISADDLKDIRTGHREPPVLVKSIR